MQSATIKYNWYNLIFLVERFLATDIFLTRVNTVFARLGVLDKSCFLSKLNRRIRLRPQDGQRQVIHLLSRAKNTDFL